MLKELLMCGIFGQCGGVNVECSMCECSMCECSKCECVDWLICGYADVRIGLRDGIFLWELIGKSNGVRWAPLIGAGGAGGNDESVNVRICRWADMRMCGLFPTVIRTESLQS